MKLQMNNIIKLIFLLAAIFFIGCSSSEYDLEQYEVNYVDKTVKADTIKKLVYDDKIKDDKIEDKKDSYEYIIQVGAFIVKSNFDKFYEKARQDLGSEVYYVVQNNLYKIRIGKFNNRAEAILLLDKIKGMGYDDAFIVTKKIN
jgi:cell division protein FtsN